MAELKLTDLISVKVLQDIQDGFAALTGMAALTTDENGATVIDVMEMKEPASHTFTNNLCVKAPFYYGERATAKATDVTTGNYTTETDPGFKNMNGGDFSIEESVVKALIPQFKAIDFSRIGRY